MYAQSQVLQCRHRVRRDCSTGGSAAAGAAQDSVHRRYAVSTEHYVLHRVPRCMPGCRRA
jgi:hypothetical protein